MMPPGRPGTTAARSVSACGPWSVLMRPHSRARCFAFAVKKAETIDRALGFSPSATASSRSRRPMSGDLAVAFSILRSLSPGANSHDRALMLSTWVVITLFVPRLRHLSVSVRLWKPQDLFGQEVQDHVRADQRGPRNQAFAQIALHMILLRIAHAAERQHGGMAGLERELAGPIFAPIGLDTALQPLVEEGRRLHHHQVRCLELRPTFGERVGNALVHSDRAVENDALAGITTG